MALLKSIVKNRGLWLSFLVLIFCYLCASLDIYSNSITEPVIEYRPSAFIYSLEAILFGGIIYVFPFCACLPGAYPASNNHTNMKIKIVYAFLCGGSAVALPFIFHTAVWNILAIPVDPIRYESHTLNMYGLINDLYDTLWGLPVYAIFSAGMFLCGGTYAVMQLAIFMWTHAQFTAFIIPTIFYMIWLKLSTMTAMFDIVTPVCLFDEGITSSNIIPSILIYLLILSISILLCWRANPREGDTYVS